MSQGIRKRTQVQQIQDQEFLFKLMQDSPEFTAIDYHVLLNDHIKERGDEYELSYPMVARIIAGIKQGYAKHVGINIQQSIINTNDRYEFLISVLADELSNRLVERVKITETVEDLVYGDISHLDEREIAILRKIELNVEKRKTVKEFIAGGVGIESVISEIDKLLKSQRQLIGMDAPKKIEKQVTKNHIFQSIQRHELIELFDKLQLPTGPLVSYLETTFKKPPQKMGEEINPEQTDTTNE